MCKEELLHNEEIKEYINIQTGEKLDLDKVSKLKDNALLKVRPDLWIEWNFKKNDELGLDIWNTTKSSAKRAWWTCPKCDSEYDNTTDSRTRLRNCPYCSGKRVNHTNSLASIKPNLAKQWHPTKNGSLTPNDITSNNSITVWWYCDKCTSSFQEKICNRRNGNCPFCIGHRVNHTNSLASLNPDLAKEWHPTKNKKTPHDFTCNSNQKVWWVCDKGHEWEAVITSRNNETGCPYCSNQRVDILNCMWTTNPELASLLANPEDGYKYTQGSNEKVDWKCSDCGEIIKKKSISNVNKKGNSCPRCSDGYSYPEKFMYQLLNFIKIEYSYQKSFEWSDSKLYDFYFNNENESLLIETHGKQHYEQTGRGRSLEEEQANDKYKYELATANGIKPENYIVIDCRYSELDFIKSNILNSRLSEIFDLSDIDWEYIHKSSLNSLVRVVCNAWNDGCDDINQLAIKTKLSNQTVSKYLRIGNDIGWCNYSASIQRSKSIKKVKLKNKKKIVQLDVNLNLIKIWENTDDIIKHLNIKNATGIYKACSKKNATSHGYRWLYLDYYKDIIDNDNTIIPKTARKSNGKIVKLNLKGEYIETYDSMIEASEEFDGNVKNTMNRISACCTGKQQSARGFKWMYLKDYEKMINNQNRIS